MKFRYGIIAILSVIVVIVLITTWGSCGCRKKHKEGMEDAADSSLEIVKNEDTEEKTEDKKIPEAMSLFTKEKPKKAHKKESFENFYHLSEGYNNLNVSVCSNCKQPNNKAKWNCEECRPPPKNHPGWGPTPAPGQRLPPQAGSRPGMASHIQQHNRARIEHFDNMSSNFNNIMFSNPTSKDEISDFFKDILFSTDCCPSSYSTDKGCACISPSQYNILRTRGDNNVPYSEF